MLAILSWLVASVWLGERVLPQFKRPLKAARALNLWLQEWQLSFSQGKPLGQLGEIPQYKFFGILAGTALTHARSYGSFPREILWEWREGLNKEIQFEKKWASLRNGGWAQFGLFALITWIFILMTAQTLSKPFPSQLLIIVTGLQLTGLVLFWPLMLWLESIHLEGFSLLIESLYVLRSLSGAGLASQQVITMAKLDLVSDIKNKYLKELKKRVLEITQMYQQKGVPLLKESQLLLQEIWFIREEALGKMIKVVEHLKLAILIVFFGGAYFVFILGLIQQLLSQA